MAQSLDAHPRQPAVDVRASISALFRFTQMAHEQLTAVWTLDDGAWLQSQLWNSAYASGSYIVHIPGLNASDAAELLVSLPLPFGDQAAMYGHILLVSRLFLSTTLHRRYCIHTLRLRSPPSAANHTAPCLLLPACSTDHRCICCGYG